MSDDATPAKVRLTDGLGPLHADESDPVRLWAEIHRLRAALQGPAGYATWQDAATAERVRRVRAEKDAARWVHVWQCVRIAQHGEYVLMPGDPTGLAEDSIARARFVREVDAALRA